MKKNYSWCIILLLLCIASRPGQAQQVSGYEFRAQTRTYVPLGSDATRLPAVEADEVIVNDIPLGFTFVMGGRFYTKVAVSSNGWMALSTLPVSDPTPSSEQLVSMGVVNAENIIAPLWADLSGSGGRAFYQTTGTAPNRVFTMEWRDFRWDKQAPQAVVSFQARLYERERTIEFNYRPEAGSVSNTGPLALARAGLNTRDEGRHVLSNLGQAPRPYSYSPGPGTLIKPANGQQYEFLYRPNRYLSCQSPESSSVTRVGRTTARVSWVLGNNWPGGQPRVHYGPLGFVLGSAAEKIAPGLPGDSAQLTDLLPASAYEYFIETDCGAANFPASTRRTSFSTFTPLSNDEASSALWLPVIEVEKQNLFTQGTCLNASASLPANSTCILPTGAVRDVWYVFRATSTSHQILLNAGPGDTHVVELRNGYGSSSRALACGTNTAPLRVNSLVVGAAYFVRVYTLAAPAIFTVGVLPGQLPPPPNDDCSAAQLLTVASGPGALPATPGTVRYATPRSGDGYAACANGNESKDVFYKFVMPSGPAEVLFRPAFEAGVEVLSSCTSGTSLSTNCIVVQAGRLGRLSLAGLPPGATYYLRVYNRNWEIHIPTDARFTIAVNSLAPAPANDECSGAQTLPLTPTGVVGVSGTLLSATSSGLQPPTSECYAAPSSFAPERYTPPSSARDVWYQFTATATTHVLGLNATRHAVVEVVQTTAGSPCASGAVVQRLGCAMARPIGPIIDGATTRPPLPARLLLPNLVVGTTYWVRVFQVTEPTARTPDGEASFDLSLHTWTTPGNDEPQNAQLVALASSLSPCSTRVEFSFDGATPSFTGTTQSEKRDLWFSFVAPPAPAGHTTSRVILRLGENEEHLQDGGMEFRDGPNVNSFVYSSQSWGRALMALRPGDSYSGLTPGKTYYLRLYSSLPNPEPFARMSLCLSVDVNNDPCSALPLPISAGGHCLQPVQGSTYGAGESRLNTGVHALIPNCGPPKGTIRDVWYRVVPATPAFTLHTDDKTITLARLYLPTAGTCDGNMQLISCQSSRAGLAEIRGLGTVLFDNLTVGQPYYLAVSNSDNYYEETGPFTLCAQTALTLPTRPATTQPQLNVWPNPVTAGELLSVQLPADLAVAAQVRVEWLSALGQVLPATGAGELPVGQGQVQVPTAGRAAGLYLLRLWLPDGQPLPVHRIVVQ
ncbi:fibronectin type III domain-containing protein [Hymenobacter metallicola]|uniref:T9SS-like galactose binding domain-containing protein n=1 Tax=Hymenobacter metallicola TaxID=2563114 RepID=A0A4Z0Q2U6_9BACT|nr:fibronectin type III domain-containing protein [Hymenobacter metallicola]TGE23042.1 hypothetical protein E5K02_22065 [Hymenobacter metallicola]